MKFGKKWLPNWNWAKNSSWIWSNNPYQLMSNAKNCAINYKILKGNHKTSRIFICRYDFGGGEKTIPFILGNLKYKFHRNKKSHSRWSTNDSNGFYSSASEYFINFSSIQIENPFKSLVFFFHLQEMRELQRKLDHDIKLKEFFAIKGNVRVNAELEAREANRKLLQQELADKQLNDLQDIMRQIQVNSKVHASNWNSTKLNNSKGVKICQMKTKLTFPNNNWKFSMRCRFYFYFGHKKILFSVTFADFTVSLLHLKQIVTALVLLLFLFVLKESDVKTRAAKRDRAMLNQYLFRRRAVLWTFFLEALNEPRSHTNTHIIISIIFRRTCEVINVTDSLRGWSRINTLRFICLSSNSLSFEWKKTKYLTEFFFAVVAASPSMGASLDWFQLRIMTTFDGSINL